MEQKLSTDVDVVYAWSHLCLPMFPGSILTCVVKTSAQIPFSAANAGQLSALKDKGKRGHQWQGIVIGAIGVEVKWTALSLSVGPVLSGA